MQQYDKCYEFIHPHIYNWSDSSSYFHRLFLMRTFTPSTDLNMDTMRRRNK